MGGRMNDAADAVSAVKVSKLVKRYGDMLALDYFDLDVHRGKSSACWGLTARRQDHGDQLHTCVAHVR